MSQTDPAAPLAPPDSLEAFYQRLASVQGQLPRRLQDCADHVLAHSERIAVSTVAEMAAGAGVPPSALMRFTQILGFSGYSEMQRLFREAFVPSLPDYETRLANLRQAAGSPAALLAEFVEAGQQSLQMLTHDFDEQALNAAVAILAKAEAIHLIGTRRAFPVAAYLSYIFEKMSVPAILHDQTGGLDHRRAMRKGDAVLVITFTPSAESTLDLAKAAIEQDLPVVALTDRPGGPLASLEVTRLMVSEVDFGSFRSLSATLALAITLAVAVGSARTK